MICMNNVGGRALLIGGVAAWLTAMSTGEEWLTKDYVFVLAVVVVVFLGGIRTAKYKRLTQHEKLQRAHDLEKLEFIHGDPVQLEPNKVTCILFFGTWCKKSREALEVFAYLNESFSHEGVQFIGLTQESREELAMYEVKGRNATNFRELKEFAFSIGIETGFMAKEYLVRCDLFSVPQVFIVGKNKSIVWYGDPCTNGVGVQIRSALGRADVDVKEKAPKILLEAVGHEEKLSKGA